MFYALKETAGLGSGFGISASRWDGLGFRRLGEERQREGKGDRVRGKGRERGERALAGKERHIALQLLRLSRTASSVNRNVYTMYIHTYVCMCMHADIPCHTMP